MSLLAAFLDLLYPPKCVFCGAFLPARDPGFCETCEKNLPFTKNGGKQSGNFFTVCLSPLYYEEDVRTAMLGYKFRKNASACVPFGHLLARHLESYLEDEIDMITWVPLSRRRLNQRGYDQAKLLAQETAVHLGLPCMPLLKKTVHTAQQSMTGSMEKRRANISGAYTVPDPSLVKGKRILLIDDIVTTGATFSECARTLGMSGAERVCCAAVARKRDE